MFNSAGFLFSFYFFEDPRDREISHSPVHSPDALVARVGQTKAGNTVWMAGTQCGWREPSYLSCHCLLPGAGGKLESDAELRTKPRDTSARLTSQVRHPNLCTNVCHLLLQF